MGWFSVSKKDLEYKPTEHEKKIMAMGLEVTREAAKRTQELLEEMRRENESDLT